MSNFDWLGLLTTIANSPTSAAAVNALTAGLSRGVAATATPPSSTVAVGQLLDQLALVAGDPAGVAAIATQIQMTAGAPMVAVVLSKELKDNASNPMMIMALAAQIKSAIAPAAQPASFASQLDFLTPTIAQTIAAKPAA